MTITTRIVTDRVLYPNGDPWVGGVTTYRLMQDSYVAGGTFPKGDITATADSDGNNSAELWCNTEGYNPSWYAYILPDGSPGTFELNSGTTPISLAALRLADNNIPWTEADINDFLEAFRIELYGALANTSDEDLGDKLVGTRATGVGGVATTVHDKLDQFYLLTDRDTFANAVTAADGKTLVINTGVTIAASVTVPATVALQFDLGGILTVPEGVTLTIDGPLTAGRYQIFDVADADATADPVLVGGSVVGNPLIDAVYPEWFGATTTADDAPAFNKSHTFADGRDVDLDATTYWVGHEDNAAPVSLLMLNAVDWRGKGSNLTFVKQGPIGNQRAYMILIAAEGDDVSFTGITFDGMNRAAKLMEVGNAAELDNQRLRVDDCVFCNAMQTANEDGSNASGLAAGLRLTGNWRMATADGSTFRDVTSTHWNSDDRVCRGLMTTRTFDENGVALTWTRALLVDNCLFQDIAPADDGDGCLMAGPKLVGLDNVFRVTNSVFINCAKRAIKSQACRTTITGNYITRTVNPKLGNNDDDADEGAAPSSEIALQFGGGVIADNVFWYPTGIAPQCIFTTNSLFASGCIIANNSVRLESKALEYVVRVGGQAELSSLNDRISGNRIIGSAGAFARIQPKGLPNTATNPAIKNLVMEDNWVSAITTSWLILSRVSNKDADGVPIPGYTFARIDVSMRNNGHNGTAIPQATIAATNITFTNSNDFIRNKGITPRLNPNMDAAADPAFETSILPANQTLTRYHNGDAKEGAIDANVAFITLTVQHGNNARVRVYCSYHTTGASGATDRLATRSDYVRNIAGNATLQLTTILASSGDSISGSWSYTRVSDTSFTISKTNHASNTSGGFWYVEIEGEPFVRFA